mmetsp:Transcript_29583/g.71497  ORF Transcript_29583/g.71497 Transcript_29583/m.71497 type:complete len:712 (-) Transcript_29583:1193-3328(-)
MDRPTKRRKRLNDRSRNSTDSSSLDEEDASGDPSTAVSSTRHSSSTDSKRKRRSNSIRRQNDKPLDLPDWYEPRQQDIIFQRGKNVLNNPGNLRYHEVIHRYKQEYQSKTTKQGKSVLLQKIVDELRSKDGANLIKQNKDTGLWYDIGDSSGRYKVGHCIRDFLKAGRESVRSSSANSSQSGTATATTESSSQRPVAKAAAQGEGKPRGKSPSASSQQQNDDKNPKKKRATTSGPKRRRGGRSSHEGDVSRTMMKKAPPATSPSQISSMTSSSQAVRTELSGNKPPSPSRTSSGQSPSIYSSTDFDFDGRNFAPMISMSGHHQNETLSSFNEEDQKPRARRSRRTDTDSARMKMSASRPSNEQSSTYGRHDMSSNSSTTATVAGAAGAAAAASSSNQTSILGTELFESAGSNQPYGHGTNYGVGSFFQPPSHFPPAGIGGLPVAASNHNFSFPFINPAAQLPFHQQQLVTGLSHPRSNSMPTFFNQINPSFGGIPGRSSSTGMAGLSQLPGSLIGRGLLSTATHQETSDPGRQGDGGVPTQLLSQSPQFQRYNGFFPDTAFAAHLPLGYGRSSSDSMLMTTSSGLPPVNDPSSLNVMAASEASSRDGSRPGSNRRYGSGINVNDSTTDPIEPRPIEEMIGMSQLYSSASSSPLNVHGVTAPESTNISSSSIIDRTLTSSNPTPQDGLESHDGSSTARDSHDDAGILPPDWM